MSGLTEKLILSEVEASFANVILSRGIHPDDNGGSPTTNERNLTLTFAKDLKSNELLGIYGDVPLRSAAEKSGRDYVALLPDACASLALWMRTYQTTTLEPVWDSWCRGVNVREDALTGVLIVTPVDTLRARAARYNREAASAFVNEFVDKKRVTLDALGRMALACDSAGQFSITAAMTYSLLPVAYWNGSDWLALRAYGSLSAAQRRAAESSGIVFAWRDLPVAIRNAIVARLTKEDVAFSERPPLAAPWSSGGVYLTEMRLDSARIASVPRDTQVKVTLSSASFLKPRSSGVVRSKLMSPGDLADLIARGPASSQMDYKRIAVVDAERVDVEVYVPGHGYVAFYAQADSATHDTEYVAPDKLPDPWKSQLAEAIKKAGGGTQ
jgi:hypothetical protein